jgi:dihydroxyacid dehydratase/phosphogluconate dehydratase
MKTLADGGLMHLDAMTVNGTTVGQNLQDAEVYNDDVIRPLAKAIYNEGALAVLKGNLAPNGCVIKPSACSPHLLTHTGPAMVFDDYPSLKKAIDDPELDVTGTRDHPAQAPAPRAARACLNGACCRSPSSW